MNSKLCCGFHLNFLLVVLHIWTLILRSTSGTTCEAIRIPMCRSMPYNITQIPNLLHHSNQLNALLVLEQYQPLVSTNCSNVLLFLLCALFTPVCPINFNQDVIPPCQDVCLRARKGCEPVLRGYNLTWPADLSCDDLPPYETGVCISPEAMNSSPNKKGRMILKRKVKNSLEISKDEKRQRESKDCVSSSYSLRLKTNTRRFLLATNSLVARATLLKVKLYSRAEISFTFTIREIYRSSSINFTVNQTTEIVSPSKVIKGSRQCGQKSPDSYHLNRDYLVLVMVEKVELKQRMRVTCLKDCFIQPWKKSVQETIRRWKPNQLKTKTSPKQSTTPKSLQRKTTQTKKQKSLHQANKA